jgi:hypothetical protein
MMVSITLCRSESLVSSCAFSVASLDFVARKSESQAKFDADVKELLRERYLVFFVVTNSWLCFIHENIFLFDFPFSMKQFVRVPLSQLKEDAVHRLTHQVQTTLSCEGFSLINLQLISDKKREKLELYSDLASFAGGKAEDFVTSNLADEEQWILDLHFKLKVRAETNSALETDVDVQSLRSQEAIETYVNKTSAVKMSSMICAASLAAIRLGRHMLLIHPPEILKAIACVIEVILFFCRNRISHLASSCFNFALRLCSPMSTIQVFTFDGFFIGLLMHFSV